jgi:PAS domain S-box-containing protein
MLYRIDERDDRPEPQDGCAVPRAGCKTGAESYGRQGLERELAASRELMNATLEATRHPIYLKDTEGVFLNCNSLFADFLGVDKSRIIGYRAEDLNAPEFSCWLAQDAESGLCSGGRDRQKKVRRAGGDSAILLFKEAPLVGDDGSARGVVGSILDITEQTRIEEELQLQATLLEDEVAQHKTVEEALREREKTLSLVVNELKESEERLSVIFEASQAGIVLVAPDGSISFANGRMAEMFGVGIDELLGTRYASWLHPSDLSEGQAQAARLVNGEIGAVNVERRYLRRDGSDFWGYLSGRRLENDDGSLRALVGSIADVTELKNTESALEREKERLAVTLRSIGDGVITVDTKGCIILLNRVAEELCGYRQEEAAGLPLDLVFHVIDERTRVAQENSVSQVLRTGEVVEQSGQSLLVSRDGRERVIASKAAPIVDRGERIPGVVLVFRDITERRQIEEELFRSSKLESLGILAGGIAHDFNNLLTGIMGNITLSRAHIPDSHQAALYLDRAHKGSERSKELTLQLLTFSKGGAPVKKLTSIPQILTDSAIFALRGSNVRCVFDIDPKLWCAEIDAGQMSQVISNLVINADQAMPGGGVILIRAENMLPLEEGDEARRIRITVKDTGAGISEEDLIRIYDPYFSTKATGNGLGLATVYAIIKNHDGEIRVFSRLNHGTTFAITLPAQEGSAPETRQTEPEPTSGDGTILLMDDEAAIREMAAAALTMFGYQPTVACDGEEMLELYRDALETGSPFGAVIMDLTVPGGMGGKEAMQKLLELDPHALAIASSGYSEDPVMANYSEYGFAGVVSKPYSLQDLDIKIQQILAKSTRS